MSLGSSRLRFNEFAKTAAVCGAVALTGTAAMATAVNVGSGTGIVTVNAGNAVWYLNNNISFNSTSSNWGFSEAALHAGGITRNDAFDGVLAWHVNASPAAASVGGYRSPSGTIDISPYPINASVGTTITGAPQTLAGLTVKGQMYFSPVKAVVRSTLILQNPTGAPITATVDIYSNLGSDANTSYRATSSGNATYDATDNWLVSCQRDTVVPANCSLTLDPILTYAYTATGAAVRPTPILAVTDGSDRQFFRYTVTVPAGLTRRVMVFEQMSDTEAHATTDAALFSTNAALQGTDYLSGMSASDQAEVVNWALAPIVAAPTDPIPPLGAATATAGVGKQPASLDLSGGKGPDMMQCLLATVRSLLGVDAQYLGQTSDGVAKIALAGGRQIAFYPLKASTDASQSYDLHLTGSNVLNVGTSCGNFTVAPAMTSLGNFGSVLDAMGVQVDISQQGVMVLTIGTTVYVARPDYLVTTGSGPTTPSFVRGPDGLFRFTDASGNVQALRPAFGDTDGLSGAAQTALGLGAGSIMIQYDGTAVLTTWNGQQYVLTPDLALTQVTAANAGNLVWQDGPNHYQYRSSTLLGLSQGFTAVPR